MKRCAWMLLLAACAAPEDPYLYSGTIEFADVEVGSLVGGRVLAVHKREGEEARAGDVLVALDPKEWQSQLDEATALADATRRELELMEAGPRKEDIAQARADSKRLELLWQVIAQGSRKEEIAEARANVKAVEAALAEAVKKLERERTLGRQGTSTSERLDAAVADQATAAARVEAAKQRVQLLERGARPDEVEAARQAHLAQQQVVKRLEAGARPEELAAKRATVKAAEARIRLATAKLAELTIAAPADCAVQTLDLRPGDLLRGGEPVAVLLLRDEPSITIYLPEKHLALVQVGQAARVQPDGHPPLAGTVTWISRRAEYTPRNVQTREERTTQVFAVKVSLQGDTSRLKDGMWADVRLQ